MDALLSRVEQVIGHDHRQLLFVLSQLAYARFLPSDEWMATFFRVTEPHLAATAQSASGRSSAAAAGRGKGTTVGKRISLKVST
jgi:hypothetical protein